MRVGANRQQNKIKFKKLSSLRNKTLCQRYCAFSEIIGQVCFFLFFPTFQPGVPSWPTGGVHPGLHPGAEEGCPGRHRLPPADIRSTGLPTGAAQHFCSSLPPPLPPPPPSLLPFIFDLVSVPLLHTRPFSPSIYFLP